MVRHLGRASLVVLAFVLLIAAAGVAAQSSAPAGQPPAAQQPPATQPPAGPPPSTQPPSTQPPPAGRTPTGQPPAGQPPSAEKPATPPATPPSAPAPPPTPPDRQAYLAATKIADNDKKIDALEKWLKDFPDSGGVSSAYSLLFDTLIKHRPTDRTPIINYAQKYIDKNNETAPEGFRHTAYSSVAGRLVTANLFLDDAARFAEKGLESFESEIKKRTERERATHLATIGRLRLKQGRTGDAEKALKAAYGANPELGAAAIGLAELSEVKKDTKAALEYWMTAALAGRLTKDERARVENAYRAANNGTLDGLEPAMDAKYRKAFPPPIHATPYKATPARTSTVVLAEVFTGAGCPPCVAADLGFDAAMERYSRKDVAVVMYHLHIPQPDPMTNKATEERAKFYRINSVPSYAINGTTGGGGGNREATKGFYNRIVGLLDKALEVKADGEIAVDAAFVGNTVKVTATPSKLAADGEPLKVQVLLVEEMLSYSGENGVRFHPMVVRSIAGHNFGGIVVDRKAAATVEHVFDLAQISADHLKYLEEFEKKRGETQSDFAFSRKPTAINPGNLSIVTFLQEEKSKKVVQSTYVRLSSTTTSSASR
jgi:tetratricopeptide (TPR) repeat protein